MLFTSPFQPRYEAGSAAEGPDLSAMYLGFILLCLLLFASAIHAQPAMTQPDPDAPERIHYRDTPQTPLFLEVYRPDADKFTGPRPAVVFFFGGGWNGGKITHFERQSRALTEHGVVGICVEYRVKSRHDTDPFECVKDAFAAMRFVNEHAEEWGLQPKRIAAGGGSAGGHLAAALATLDPAKYIEAEDLAEDRAVYRPDALVLFNAVYDNSKKGYAYERIGERYVDFSPRHNLHKDMPPTLVMLGDSDTLISVDIAEAFRDEMLDLEVRSELIIYEGEAHGFFNRGESLEKTIQAMLEFLASLGYLELN